MDELRAHDERYLRPEIPDPSLDAEYAEREEHAVMRVAIGLYQKRWKQVEETQSFQKNISANNYPAEPFNRSLKERVVSSPLAQFPHARPGQYPDAPIFPTEPGLNSKLGDYGRQEGIQAAMNGKLRMLPSYWRGRFEEGAPPGIF